ncbi:MAG: RNA polymerase sigma factor [Chloroflexota bacterium]
MPYEIESDLLQQAQAGDYDAFEQLQARLEAPIRRFIRRLIGVRDAEDDIVQDTFIALYYSLDRIEPVENLRPYLFRIARNCCYDELRDQGRFESVSLDGEFEENLNVTLSFNHPAEGSNQPDEAVHWLLVSLEVKAAIDRLPEPQRQALILYAEENLSYAEIAIATQTNIGTVKSRLHHAKKALPYLLKPETYHLLETEFQQGD